MLFATGRALFDARIGFWSAIVFATAPGVSYSSHLMTTDVPLILLWTVMLYFWVMLVKRKSMGFAILLGVAVGVGLLAKQAMIYAVFCAACHAAVSREAREALKGGRGLVAVSSRLRCSRRISCGMRKTTSHGEAHRRQYRLGVSLRSSHRSARLCDRPVRRVRSHSAGRAGARGFREIRVPRDQRKILLLSFSLPVLALLLVQALLSRAHGNWSATAYPAATIFVTAVMLELNRRVLFRVSLGLHLVVAVMIAAAPPSHGNGRFSSSSVPA